MQCFIGEVKEIQFIREGCDEEGESPPEAGIMWDDDTTWDNGTYWS